MRIAGISAVFPSQIMSNEVILDLIRKESEGRFQGNLERALRQIRHFFHYSGLENRRWLTPEEKPIEMLSRVVSEALEEGECRRHDVDWLIYTGVGGGFREPGNSYMVAHALGFHSAQCFDLNDACMSWSRALQLAYHAFRADEGPARVLIVNAECNMISGGVGLPALFRLSNRAELDWRFPAYTGGEAVTAALLIKDPSREWEFHFSSFPDLADLCTIPEWGYERYCAIGLGNASEEARGRIGKNGVNLFTSFGTELFRMVAKEAPVIFNKLRCPREEIRMAFPHAVSKKLFEDAAKEVGSPPVYYVYPQYGNLVSASVPAGIDLARKEGLIKRGDRLVGWVCSAGMSFASYSFIY